MSFKRDEKGFFQITEKIEKFELKEHKNWLVNEALDHRTGNIAPKKKSIIKNGKHGHCKA